MKKVLPIILTVVFAINAHAQIFEMGSDKEQVRAPSRQENSAVPPNMQDLRIDLDAIKKSPNAAAFDLKEELLFEQKDNRVDNKRDKKTVVEKVEKTEKLEKVEAIDNKAELKAIKPQDVKREPIANIELEKDKRVVVATDNPKLVTREQMCYRETDAVVGMLGLNGKRQDLIKTYLNSLCLKDIDVENYQKIYADAKKENEQNVLNLIRDYKIQSFSTIEQKLVHIKLLTLTGNLKEEEVYKVYSDLVSLYENFLIQENMANFILTEELKSIKDKKLAKQLGDRIDKEIKSKQHSLSIRVIYYLNYVFNNGMYEKAKEFDKLFIPKILDKSNKNSFLNAKLSVEQCDYLNHAIPNISLNSLKITCIIDSTVK